MLLNAFRKSMRSPPSAISVSAPPKGFSLTNPRSHPRNDAPPFLAYRPNPWIALCPPFPGRLHFPLVLLSYSG